MRNRYLATAAAALIILSTAYYLSYLVEKPENPDNLLMSGRLLPDFTLTGVDGKPVSLEMFRGRVVLIFFGYTSCPDICPMALKKLGEMERLLGPRSDEVVTIFITTDIRDDSERLSQFVQGFGDRIVPLTGSWQDLAEVWAAYHVRPVEPEKPGGYAIHSSIIFLADRELVLRKLLTPEMPVDYMYSEVLKYL